MMQQQQIMMQQQQIMMMKGQGKGVPPAPPGKGKKGFGKGSAPGKFKKNAAYVEPDTEDTQSNFAKVPSMRYDSSSSNQPKHAGPRKGYSNTIIIDGFFKILVKFQYFS